VIQLAAGDCALVLTGAGISVASGIRPFRGAGGWWTDDPEAERAATSPELLHRPDLIWEIYGPLRPLMRRAEPEDPETNKAYVWAAGPSPIAASRLRTV